MLSDYVEVSMTHTWNWLFVTLQKDEKSKLEVIKNIFRHIYCCAFY